MIGQASEENGQSYKMVSTCAMMNTNGDGQNRDKMNDINIERQMAENGFTAKELSIFRRHLKKGMATHLSLLSELKKRFIVSSVIIVILIIGLIITLVYGSERNLVSYAFMFIVVSAIIYTFTPMKLGYKAYCFLKNNNHLL